MANAIPASSTTYASPSVLASLLASASTILTPLVAGFKAEEAALIASLASFSMSELIKLGKEELAQLNVSIAKFLAGLRSGMTWGAAMADMLTSVWNNTKSDLAGIATDFVEAVGKLFQSVGLVPAA